MQLVPIRIFSKGATGANGHENTETHQKNAEKFEKNNILLENLAKEKLVLPKAIEKQRMIKLFEYKLLNFCFSKNKPT